MSEQLACAGHRQAVPTFRVWREVAKTAKGAFHVRGAGVLETSLGRSRSMIAPSRSGGAVDWGLAAPTMDPC